MSETFLQAIYLESYSGDEIRVEGDGDGDLTIDNCDCGASLPIVLSKLSAEKLRDHLNKVLPKKGN